MASLRLKPVVAFVAAGSLFVSSTGAIAAQSAPSAQQVNPWAALTAMSAGAPAAALCGSAAVAAAAQPAAGCVLPVVDQPVVANTGPPPPTPVPPVEPVGGGIGISPLWLALGAIAAGALVYFLLLRHHHHNASPD